MTTQKLEDIKDTAVKLDEIHSQSPEDYFYLKGWIHCLLQKENKNNTQNYRNIKQSMQHTKDMPGQISMQNLM